MSPHASAPRSPLRRRVCNAGESTPRSQPPWGPGREALCKGMFCVTRFPTEGDSLSPSSVCVSHGAEKLVPPAQGLARDSVQGRLAHVLLQPHLGGSAGSVAFATVSLPGNCVSISKSADCPSLTAF